MKYLYTGIIVPGGMENESGDSPRAAYRVP
jgi:hypothetical protein